MVTSCQLRTSWRGVRLFGFQLAAGERLDLVGAALGDCCSPAGHSGFVNAQRFSRFGNTTEVVEYVSFLHGLKILTGLHCLTFARLDHPNPCGQ